MSRALRLRLVDLACVAAACLLLPSTPWGDPGVLGIVLLTVAIGFSNTALIHVTVARQRVSFTLTEGLIAGAYLMAPGSWIILPAVVGLVPMLVINKSSVLKIQHNVAQYIVATSVASFVVAALHGTIPACVVGMAAWWVASQIMSAIPLSIMGGESLRKMLFEDAALQAVHATGTTSIGLLAAWLTINAPFGLLGLLVPIVLLWISFDEQTSKSGEARLFAELARGHAGGDDVADPPLVVTPVLVDDGAVLGRERRQLVQRHEVLDLAAVQVFQMRAHQCRHALRRGTGGVEQRERLLVGFLRDAQADRVEDLLLRREVVIEARAADADGLGDVAHADGRVAVAREGARSGGDDLGPPRPGRSCHTGPFRSSRLSTWPCESTGSSATTCTAFGTLNAASRSRQNAMIPAGSGSAPGRGTTNAVTASDQ